jgi:hypothetical protein
MVTKVKGSVRADGNYDNLDDAVADAADLSIGDVLILKERTSGYGGGGTWDVITDIGNALAIADGQHSVITLGADLSLQLRPSLTVNAAQFGDMGAADRTDTVQAAIDYVKDLAIATMGTSGGGGIVNINYGVHPITKITRRSGVSIIGQGSFSTFFTALTLTESDPYGMVEIEEGPVVGSHMKGITFCGGNTISALVPVNTNQWGHYIHAKWDAGYTSGGLWLCNHEDVYFKHFNYGVWSRGGYTTAHSSRPNQFLKFINCFCLVADGGESLRLTGQHGQIEFTGGDYSGHANIKAALAVAIDYDPDPSTTADDASGSGESTSDISGVGSAIRTPANVAFNGGMAIQRSGYGVYARDCQNISFDEVWFESLGGAVELSSAGSLTISYSRLANAGDGDRLTTPSTGNGWLLKQGSSSSIEWGQGNFVTGTTDNWLDPTANLTNISTSKFSRAQVSSKDMIVAATPYAVTVGASGDINTKGHDMVYVTSNANKAVFLIDIDSYLVPGNDLVIYATAGAVTFKNTGNIRPPRNANTVTIGHGTYATLKRIHKLSGFEWFITSIQDEYNTAAPTSGEYYHKGTVIRNTLVSAGGSPGWIVTTAGLAGTTAVFKALANVAA